MEEIDKSEWVTPSDPAFDKIRLKRLGATVHSSWRGGVEIRVKRRIFGGILFWYLENGHITAVQARAGRRFYILWYFGSIRGRHRTMRFTPMPAGLLESENLEAMQRAYHEARKAIRGVKEKRTAHRVCCIGERAGDHGELHQLRSALDDLAGHFGYSQND